MIGWILLSVISGWILCRTWQTVRGGPGFYICVGPKAEQRIRDSGSGLTLHQWYSYASAVYEVLIAESTNNTVEIIDKEGDVLSVPLRPDQTDFNTRLPWE